MRIDSNVFEAEGIDSALEKLGIDWGSQLELDGVDSFKKGFDSFLYSLQEKAKSLKLVSLFVGNIDSQVTETLLAKVFSSISPIEGCKLVRKEKSSYGFIHYLDRRSAASAMSFLNGKQLFGLAIKVSWANASGKREDTSSHYNIFVGDLSSVVTDDMLLACFSVYPSCSGARVMWDQKTGRSRGFGFVSFRNQQVLTSIVQENRLVVGRSVVTGLQKVLELMMTSRALMPKVWGSYQMAFQHKKIRMLAGRLEVC